MDAPVYILEEYYSIPTTGNCGSADRNPVWQMCQDITNRFDWTVVPQFDCGYVRQDTCRLLIFNHGTIAGNERISHEEVLEIRAFIAGWEAAYKRRPKIKKK